MKATYAINLSASNKDQEVYLKIIIILLLQLIYEFI